jgi:aryl-alcohol dehydrogenase-like predicted oxidoreductase
MEKRRFGKTDMQVAVLGFGGAEIGMSGSAADSAGKLLNEALDAGLNVLDTAECYMTSEELIGKTVASRRKDYYLFTKSGHPEGLNGSENWTKKSILETLERSLKRLNTDHVDLLQLHSCSLAELKKGECIEALDEAKKAGKTRYIGYSGDSDAALWAVQSGRFDALQISVSVADQEAIDRVLPEAKKAGLGVIAKRPIANAAWLYTARPNEYHAPYWERLGELKYPELAGQDAFEIALKFTLSQAVHTAIVGTQKPGRYTENARMVSGGAQLDSKVIERIRGRWREVAKPGWIGQI